MVIFQFAMLVYQRVLWVNGMMEWFFMENQWLIIMDEYYGELFH